jgi:ribose transport system substrate-binding protein
VFTHRHSSRVGRRAAAIAATAIVSVLGLAACGSSSGGATTSTPNAGASTGSGSGLTVAAASAKLAALYKGTFTAPPASAPTPAKGVDLWIISCGQASEGCAEPVAGAQAAAKLLGWQTHVFDGNFGAADAFNTGIRQAVAAHATAIMALGVDCNLVSAGLSAAAAANVPVIGINSFDCNDPMLNAGPAKFAGHIEYIPSASSVGEWQEAQGAAKADWMIANLNGNVNAIVLKLNGVTALAYQIKGFEDELAKCTSCHVLTTVAGNPPDLSNGVLKQAFSTALTKYPQANAIMSPDDSISAAVGEPSALQAAGRAKSVKVVGTGAYAQNIDEIRNGNGESAEVAYDDTWIGWAGVDETIRALAKSPMVPEGDGFQLVDATHNLPASGQGFTTSTDYIAGYKKAWGLG